MSIEAVFVLVLVLVPASTVFALGMFWVKINRVREEVMDALAHLIEGKRLSQALALRLKSGIEFPLAEPKKEVLAARIRPTLEEHWRVTDLDNFAYISMLSVGVKDFVADETFYCLKRALRQYRLNDDMEGACAFLEVVVSQL